MFNMRKFLTKEFESPAETCRLLLLYGIPATQSAVAKWFQRGSVSGSRLAELLCIRELEAGAPVRMTSYWETT